MTATAKPWTTITLAGGCLGAMVQDPGSTRWLWSVRWPAHRCLGDKCETPPAPQLFRHGTAPSAKSARDAIASAHAEGPPPAGQWFSVREGVIAA